jgi:hypothetical protein
VIKDRDATIGYHCPYCGISILNNINIFLMDDNLLKIKCVCGASELSVQAVKGNKYKMSVPCILCPSPHVFTLSSDTFFKKDLFPFSCKFTAINICFIGRGNRVYEALKSNEEELMQIFAAFEEEYGDGDDADTDIDMDAADMIPEDFFNGFNNLDGLGGDFYLNGVIDPLDPYDGYDKYDRLGGYLKDELAGVADLLGLGQKNSKESGFEFESEPEPEPGFRLHKNKDFGAVPDAPEPARKITGDTDGALDNLDNIRLSSYQAVTLVLDALSRLYADGKIYCKCRETDLKVVLLGNSVHIECVACASYRNIRSANLSDAEYLGGVEELYMDYDDD